MIFDALRGDEEERTGAYKLYVRIHDDEGNEVRHKKHPACVLNLNYH